MPGTTTVEAEVKNISKHCFWLLLGNEELAVSFKDFPWFKSATVSSYSLNLTRNGKRRKAGAQWLRHYRAPALRRLPPLAG